MFRNSDTTVDGFLKKFELLKKGLDKRAEMLLDSAYHQDLKSYIVRLYGQTCQHENFTKVDFDNMREAEMSNLNRLQKLKNSSSYKKDKHKASRQNEDWG